MDELRGLTIDCGQPLSSLVEAGTTVVRLFAGMVTSGISSGDQDAPRDACRAPSADVAHLVSDHNGTPKVERKLLRCLEKQTRCRLSAVACPSVSSESFSRMVGTVIDSGKVYTQRRKLRPKMTRQPLEVRFRVVTASNAGLIGDNDQCESGFL